MKKRIIIVLLLIVCFCLACSKETSKKSRTAEEMLDQYIVAYMKADVDSIKELFPKFFVEYNKEIFTKKYFEEIIEKDKNEYGEDFKITYEIKEKIKLSSDELNKINDSIKNYFKTDEVASECYGLDGTMTWSGSKSTDTDPLETYYCQYDGTWYMLVD